MKGLFLLAIILIGHLSFASSCPDFLDDTSAVYLKVIDSLVDDGHLTLKELKELAASPKATTPLRYHGEPHAYGAGKEVLIDLAKEIVPANWAGVRSHLKYKIAQMQKINAETKIAKQDTATTIDPHLVGQFQLTLQHAAVDQMMTTHDGQLFWTSSPGVGHDWQIDTFVHLGFNQGINIGRWLTLHSLYESRDHRLFVVGYEVDEEQLEKKAKTKLKGRRIFVYELGSNQLTTLMLPEEREADRLLAPFLFEDKNNTLKVGTFVRSTVPFKDHVIELVIQTVSSTNTDAQTISLPHRVESYQALHRKQREPLILMNTEEHYVEYMEAFNPYEVSSRKHQQIIDLEFPNSPLISKERMEIISSNVSEMDLPDGRQIFGYWEGNPRDQKTGHYLIFDKIKPKKPMATIKIPSQLEPLIDIPVISFHLDTYGKLRLVFMTASAISWIDISTHPEPSKVFTFPIHENRSQTTPSQSILPFYDNSGKMMIAAQSDDYIYVGGSDIMTLWAAVKREDFNTKARPLAFYRNDAGKTFLASPNRNSTAIQQFQIESRSAR